MSKVYGYARISTAKQSITRQIDNIKEHDKDAEIYSEAFTGTKEADKRPEFSKLLKRVKAGDTIIFDEISRMSRNAEDGYKTYKELFDKGVNLIFLKERTLDTINFRQTQQLAFTGQQIADIYIEATNRVLMLLAEQQIKAAFESAEHEVDFLHKRTADGMKASHAGEKISASKTGKTIETKKAKEYKAIIRKSSKDFEGSLNDAELMKLTGLARNTFYKYKKELREAAV